MKRLIQTLALGAALAAVSVGVWRDYEAVTTLKRAAVAYLSVYFVAGVIYLAGNAALRAVHEKPPPEEPDDARPANKHKQRARTALGAHGKAPRPVPSADDANDEQLAAKAYMV